MVFWVSILKAGRLPAGFSISHYNGKEVIRESESYRSPNNTAMLTLNVLTNSICSHLDPFGLGY
jgi:hypothetical protein